MDSALLSSPRLGAAQSIRLLDRRHRAGDRLARLLALAPAALGREREPLIGFRQVARDPFAAGIEPTEIVLRGPVAALRQRRPGPDRRRIVALCVGAQPVLKLRSGLGLGGSGGADRDAQRED